MVEWVVSEQRQKLWAGMKNAKKQKKKTNKKEVCLAYPGVFEIVP